MYNYEMFKSLGALPFDMKEESVFLDYVGGSSQMRILQHLIEGRELDYTLTDLLHANVSWGTFNKVVPKLAKLGMVVKTRKIGRATLYRLNMGNEAAKQLTILYDKLIIDELKKRSSQKIRAVAR